MSEQRRKKMGEYLVEAHLISAENLSCALKLQHGKKKRLGQILIEMGVANDQMIAEALSSQMKIPLIDLERENISLAAIALVSSKLAWKNILVPIRKTEKSLLVAMADPLAPYAIDELGFATNLKIEVTIASESQVQAALKKYYPRISVDGDVEEIGERSEGIEIIQRKEIPDRDKRDVAKLEVLAELPPIVRFLNAILSDAIRLRASDIHIEPENTAVLIRYRIDGIMQEVMKTDRHVLPTLVSRIKVISNMDIAVRRRPQDGKTQVRSGDKIYDLRVSTMPTSYGEKVTIRLLDPSAAGIGLEDLGFSPNILKNLVQGISHPQGIVLVTGPTGSGKSSTLYACLNHIKSPEINIITLEDPIEFDMAGVSQVQVNPKAGLTFASGLRTILRQDPDVVMLGEIRDSETADIACKAAQTGHLVLSTLHTNDAPSALMRLMDLGVEPFQLSASLIAVMGQRLVRKICPECKSPEPVNPIFDERLAFFLKQHEQAVFWHGSGCEACQFKGYSGRLGIHELLMMSPTVRERMTPGMSVDELRKVAETEGYRPLSFDGLDKALAGLTTLDEIFRVAPPETERSEPTPSVAEPLVKSENILPEPPAVEALEEQSKILIVDDNEMARKILYGILTEQGYSVVAATNGSEAYKLAITENPDLILSDYIMPVMDGLMLVKMLKTQLSTRYIPVIMLTSKDEVASEVELIEAGVDDYLTKPVNAKRLLARVGRLLERPVTAQM